MRCVPTVLAFAIAGAFAVRPALAQDAAPPPRTDLPPVAQTISKLPPENWPAFDASKPDTDFQLQQGETVLKAMAVQKRAQR